MKLSAFGQKYTKRCGILELMEDMGRALASDEKKYMLGGGNPAQIQAVNEIWESMMHGMLHEGQDLVRALSNYETQRGRLSFLEAIADFLHRNYGWQVTEKNVAVTNGSQTAFYILLNLFAGPCADGEGRRVVLPLLPEYIGYADQGIGADHFVGFRPTIAETGDHGFKYHVDFNSLEFPADAGAVCVSRPTNPTGNVLSDEELRRLSEMAEARGLPFLLDNAYGAPFPQIIFEDVRPFWNEHIIYGMSLSKLGLPSARTGIIVASEEVIEAVAACNAVISLSIASIGQALVEPLLRSDEILTISRNLIRPFYRERSREAQEWIREAFPPSIDYAVHRSQGAIFLWIWFKNLRASTRVLYERLKERGVIVVPGEYFFFGLEDDWPHRHQCIRLNYAAAADDVRRGLEIIGREAARLVAG